MALAIAILIFSQKFAIFNIVVVSTALCVKEGVVAGVISPKVIVGIVCMVDLIVSHVLKRGVL